MGRGLLCFTLLASAACAAADTKPPAPSPPRRETPAAQHVVLPFGDFVERRSSGRTARIALDGGATLAVIDDQRVLFDPRGRVIGASESPPQGRGVVAIPKALGGGFAIHAPTGLFRIAAPLEPLERVVAFGVQNVSFGPRGALVELEDGRRRLVDLQRGTIAPVTPASAVAMTVAGPRLAGALLEDGSVLVSRDGGAAWTAGPDHPHRFSDVIVDDKGTGLVLIDEAGGAQLLDDKRLVPVPLPAQRPTQGAIDPRWVGSEEPLEATVARGAVLDDGHAIVSARGAIFILDRASGAIDTVEAGVLPPNRPCIALGMSREILFACPEDGRMSVFRRPRAGGPVQAEITFAGTGHLVRGDGDALLYTGACEGDATKVGTACLRKKDGAWAPIDRSALFAAQPGGVVLAWVPTDTSAFAILGGDVGGILDAATGERSVLEKPAAQKLATLVPARTDAVEHRLRAVEGGIEGWSQNGDYIRIEKGGAAVKVAPFKLPNVRFAGPRGLAVGPEDTLWQTTDWGKTFVEVPAPPFRVGQPSSCGETGCMFSQWMRRGWRDERARPNKRERKSEPSLSLPAPSLPELRCAIAGAQSTRSRPPDASESPFGFGAELLRVGEIVTTYAEGPDDPMGRLGQRDGIRAIEAGPPSRAPDGALDPSSTRRLRFTLPFDPSGAIQSATYRASALIEAARRVGETRPTTSEIEGSGHATPVLVAPGAPTELLLVRDNLGIATWLRGKDSVAISTRTPNADLGAITGAARRGDGLVLLAMDGSGDVHVLGAGPGHLEQLFAVPAKRNAGPRPRTMDALGVGANGEPVVIRMHAHTPPDAADPALLLAAGTAPGILAPWSTLTADGAPGCESSEGTRALITTDPPWIQMGPQPPDAGRMTARVRWTATRVCLEAVELTNATHETPAGNAESTMVSTFGAKAKAGLVLVDRGVELREPRSCQLVAPAVGR